MELHYVVCTSVGRMINLEVSDQPIGIWVRHDIVSSGGLLGSCGSACVVIIGLAPLLSLCAQIDHSAIFELLAKTREGGGAAIEVAHHQHWSCWLLVDVVEYGSE